MKSRHITMTVGVMIAGMFVLLAQYGSRADGVDAKGPSTQNGVEVLTRGPVHEAFAEPNSYNPTPRPVVPKQAPSAIEEIPPAEKPSDDSLWIPGYWQWDDERTDFIWISGIWRVPPPGCAWVPGYWTAATNGWSWTPGFWLANEAGEVTYLPQPPKSLEIGPSSPAPSPDRIWASGCWFWTDAHYAWRPGYWVQARPDWVWSPAYYIDTPRGSVYVDGYWDWTLDRRGVLFAPVYIQRSLWERPDYVYSPSIVIQSDLLTSCLFISPSYGHYYFGDYYDASYSSAGIFPWFEYHTNYRGYDPIYAHERWRRSRTDSQWDTRLRQNYDYRTTHADARPARTYSAQTADALRSPQRGLKNAQLAAPLSSVAKQSNTSTRYATINADQRKSLGTQGKELAKYRDQRTQWESPGKQASQRRPAQAVTRTTKAPPASLGTPSSKTGVDQPVRSSITKAPVLVQTNRVTTRQRDVQTPQPMVREKSSSAPESMPPQRQMIPRSPIRGRSAGDPSQGAHPPSRPESPRSDSNFRSQAAPSRDNAKSEPPSSRASSPSEGRSPDKKDNAGGKNRRQ